MAPVLLILRLHFLFPKRERDLEGNNAFIVVDK